MNQENAHGQGLQFWKELEDHTLTSNFTINSEGSVQIDGVNGYRFNYTSKNGSDLVYSEGVTFIFVKNNKKYDFEVSTHNICAIESDINTIGL